MGSAEETDCLTRMISKGFHVHYCPEIMVFHPDKKDGPERAKSNARGESNARGVGRVLRKWGPRLLFSRLAAGALLRWVRNRFRKNPQEALRFREQFFGYLSGFWS